MNIHLLLRDNKFKILIKGSGVYGAGEMSRILQSRYKELEFIFDEGSFILKKSFPGIVGLNTAFIGKVINNKIENT